MFVPFPVRWDMLALSLEGISSYQDIGFGEAEGLKININHIKTTTATTRWAPILIKFSLHLNTIEFQPPKTTRRLFKTAKKKPRKTHPSWQAPDIKPAPCNFTGPTAPAEELREPWCFFSTLRPKNPGWINGDAMKTSSQKQGGAPDPLFFSWSYGAPDQNDLLNLRTWGYNSIYTIHNWIWGPLFVGPLSLIASLTLENDGWKLEDDPVFSLGWPILRGNATILWGWFDFL